MPKRSRPDDDNDNPNRAVDKARWTRIMNRRRQDLEDLDLPTIQTILTKVPQVPNSSIDNSNGKSPMDLLLERLWEHMEIAGDETQPTSQRRQSWGVITSTFAQVDVELKREPRHPQSTIATARSVLDWINLSATSSTVPAGVFSFPISNISAGRSLAVQNSTTGAAVPRNSPITHPVMQQSSSIPSNTATGTIPHSSTTRAVFGTSVPTHPAILQRQHSKATAAHGVPSGTAGLTGLVHPELQTNAATATATRAFALARSVHPAMQNKVAAPISPGASAPPVMQNNSAATVRANGLSALTDLVHPVFQNNTATAMATEASLHPVLQNYAAVATATGSSENSTPATLARQQIATSTPEVIGSDNNSNGIDQASQSGSLNSTATSTTTTSNHQLTSLTKKPNVHPALQRKFSSPGKATAASGTLATATNESATNTLPVHSPLQNKSSSAGTAATAGRAASTGTNTTASGSSTTNSNSGNLSAHSPMQRNSSSVGATANPTQTFMSYSTLGNYQSHSTPANFSVPIVQKESGSRNGGAPTNTASLNIVDSSSSNGLASASSRTAQTGTQTALVAPPRTAPLNQSVPGQTSQSNSTKTETPRAAGTTTSVSSQFESGGSEQNRPEQNVSQPAAAAQPQANQSTTAVPSNRSTTIQPATSRDENTASTATETATTLMGNGTTTTSLTAAKSAKKTGQNGTVQNGAGDKSKENKKPNPTTKKKPVVDDKPRIDEKEKEISFPADKGEGGLTGCCFERPPCTVTFHRYQHVPPKLTGSAVKRFLSTEPYWSLVTPLDLTLTSKVERVEWTTCMGSNNNEPKRVWSKTFAENSKVMSNISDKITNWGVERDNPENLEYRLMLRMLPVNVDEKMKKKRADCHLWPKGTMLVVNGKAQPLIQRKQQFHDKSEWKQMCQPFDLSSVISFPLHQHTIQICCLDPDEYFVSLGMCQYRTPDFHVRKLLGEKPECSMNPKGHNLQCLTIEESTKKAKETMNQQADDDNDNANKNDGVVGKFIFSLIDPVNKVAIKNPVRGKKCKHWQVRYCSKQWIADSTFKSNIIALLKCFDLETFMRSNLTVYGSRWRCPCCEQFLKYHELELCALTQAALDKYKDHVTPTRCRVEYREDGTYELLPEDRLRHSTNKRHSSASGGENESVVQPKQAPGEPKPRPAVQIEIIEIDSD